MSGFGLIIKYHHDHGFKQGDIRERGKVFLNKDFENDTSESDLYQQNVNNETRYHHFEPELSFILADLDCKKQTLHYLLIACQLEGCHHKFVGARAS